MKQSKLTVLKIGGQLLDDKTARQQALQAFCKIEGPKILVHGGGQKASQLSEQLGIKPKMVKGRRVTDAATLQIVTMVYAGLLNKTLVAELQAMGQNALGLSGADLDVIRAEKRKDKSIDYGFAGDIQQVQTKTLEVLLQQNICPVFCSITHDGQEQLLNTNADTIATELAIALSQSYQTQLLFCFEKAGVLANPADEQSLILKINPQHFREYQNSGVISGGMLPKLSNAFRALNQNVHKVFIRGLNHQGTEVCLA